MIIRNLLAWGICLLMLAVGASMIVGNFGTASDGWTIHRQGQPIEAVITDKQVDRPARRTGARTESISVNDTRVRSFSTYFNDYLLTVSYTGADGPVTATAPVSFDRWHEERSGRTITVTATNQVSAYVDATSRATLFYALKQMGIGLLMMAIGIAALWLPDK